MPKGPKGKRRPADANGRAVMIAKVPSGEPAGDAPNDGKNKAAQELGRMGGKARARAISARRRKEIAKKAAACRWKA